ncbi:hypothetical protein RND71_028813 [Anisodus tanguticus]|uniref:Uncharacterized protein n=1 Tax=Anisodus tanguticus TaxID=243964 RepID=A0AAE1RKG6_9SOLA|nr:hypothetical protein RND71_028813 [Anisodus tanguticus]
MGHIGIRPAPLFTRRAKGPRHSRMNVTNVNECKLHCPNTIGADHTRCYRSSKRGQTMTIERLSLSIPSHTEKRSNGKVIRPFGSLRSIAHIQTSNWEREGLPCRMPMGVGFFEKAQAESET